MIKFNYLIDMLTVATPSSGYVIGYDLDGVLKQKDTLGVISSFGGGPTGPQGPTGPGGVTPSLSSVLSVGNITGANNIIISEGQIISSSTGSAYLSLDNGSPDSLTLVNGFSSGFSADSTTSQMFCLATGGYSYIDAENIQLTAQDLFEMGVNPSYNIQIYNNTVMSTTSSGFNKSSVFINSSGSSFLAGVSNAVIIGGSGLYATTSDTVYLGNYVNINNAYTLPNTDGTSNQVLKTDGAGNVTWQTDTSGSTPSLSQVLAVGNTDGGYSIIMSTSSYISDSSNKNTFIINDGYGQKGIYIGTDNYGFTSSYTYYQNGYISYQNYIEQAVIRNGSNNSAIYLYVADTSYTSDSSIFLDSTYVSMYKAGTPFPRSISIYDNEISMLGNLNHTGWANISYNVISGYTYNGRLNIVEDQYPNTTNYVLRTSIDNTNVILGVRADKVVNIGSTGGTASFRYVDGNQNSGYVLKSDSNGYASWSPLSSIGGVTGSGVNGRIALWNSSGQITYNDLIRYGSGDIQIGTSSDPSRVLITSNAVTIEGAASYPQNILTAYGLVYPQTVYTKYNGSPSSPTSTTSGDVIHEWRFSGSAGIGSRWFVKAAETQTVNTGTTFELHTAVVGTTSVAERFAISGTGEIRFNGQGTYSYTFPTYRGSNGNIMQTNGSGTINWISATESGLGGFSGTFSADGQIVTVVGGIITSVV